MQASSTRVTVDTDLKIVGKLAQFGSGMLQQVSEKLLGQFVESLEAKLAAADEPLAAAPLGDSSVQDAAAGPRRPPDGRSTCSSWRADALKKYGPPIFGVFLLAAVVRRLAGWGWAESARSRRRP